MPLALALAVLSFSFLASAEPVDLCQAARARGYVAAQDGSVLLPFETELARRPPVTPLEYLQKSSIDGMGRTFEAMSAQGVVPIVLIVPPRLVVLADQLDLPKNNSWSTKVPEREYRAILQILGEQAQVVNGLDVLREAKLEQPYFKADPHWTPQAADAIGQAVAELIRSTPQGSKLSHIQYETKEGKPFELEASARNVSKHCPELDLPKRNFLKRHTTSTEADALGLLGEAPPPPIALAGTSFSGAHYNLAGSIKEHAEADVLLYNVGGGGMFSAMLTYLRSDNYQNDPAAFVLWEVNFDTMRQPSLAERPTFNHDDVFRQVWPAAARACTATDVLVEGKGPVASNRVVAIEVPTSVDTKGTDVALKLELADVGKKSFTVHSVYRGGGSDDYTVKAYGRLKGTGRYFVSVGGKRALERIELVFPEGADGMDVSAQLCGL